MKKRTINNLLIKAMMVICSPVLILCFGIIGVILSIIGVDSDNSYDED